MNFFKQDFLGNKNNRKNQRTSLCVLVEEPGKKQEYFDKSTNISASGIFIETENPRAEGEEITLRFALPGSKVMTVLGKVSRVHKKSRFSLRKSRSGMGIQFTQIEANDQNLIRHFTGE